MPDEDGYPTQAELHEIEKHDFKDPFGWFDRVKDAWWCSNWGFTEFDDGDAKVYLISTGGWSGNEEIISSMQANFVLWSLYWKENKAGGHYLFRVDLNHLQGVEPRPKSNAEEFYKGFLEWRGLDPEDVCEDCSGAGYKLYPTTATHHGGVGGMTPTMGRCSSCWGSGSKTTKWWPRVDKTGVKL